MTSTILVRRSWLQEIKMTIKKSIYFFHFYETVSHSKRLRSSSYNFIIPFTDSIKNKPPTLYVNAKSIVYQQKLIPFTSTAIAYLLLPAFSSTT
jgi:hypothetical protein